MNPSGILGFTNPSNTSSAEGEGKVGVLDYGIRVAPFSVLYDPNQELIVTFEIPNGDTTNLVTLWIPKRATAENARLEIDVADEDGQFSLNGLNVGIKLYSVNGGREITTLAKPLEIRPWFEVKTPRLIENGSCSPQFLKLRTRYLPKSYVAGYYIDSNKLLTLYTRKLSRVSTAPLSSGEKFCLVDRVGFTPATREFNRVIVANFSPNPYLLINLKEKFGNKVVDLKLRRNVNGEVSLTHFATVSVNAVGDALLPLTEKLMKWDRFRIRIGKFPLAVKTVALVNP